MANHYVVSFSLSNSNWSVITAGSAGITVRKIEVSLGTSSPASGGADPVVFTLARLGGITGGFPVAINPVIDGNPIAALATATGNATASPTANLTNWDVPVPSSVHEFDFEGESGITVAPSDSLGISAAVGSTHSGLVNIWFEV